MDRSPVSGGSRRKERALLGATAVASWAAAVTVKDVIRPAVHHPAPSLQFLLGSAPSLLSALAIPLFFLAVHPRPTGTEVGRVALYAVGIVLVAEGIEVILPGSTFDWRDILAAFAGIVVATTLAWRALRPTANA